MKRQELEDYLASLLEVDGFKDYCVNGLQVEGREDIQRIVTGVSVSRRLFAEAVMRKADAVIVHHGLFWNSDPSPFYLTGLQAARVHDLMAHNINLFGYHLPLDSHPTLGNNARIAMRLGMDVVDRVTIEDWRDAGYICELPVAVSTADFRENVDELLGTEAMLFGFGAENVHRVFVCSGGSSGYYYVAIENNCDTFLGGEIKESMVRLVEEAGLNFVAAGHYNTEKWGIQALGDHLREKLGLDVDWIDIPNPV
jgi:dinuclear metal center YbgI/SA1388 family protein